VRVGIVTQPGHAVLPPAGSLEIWGYEVARRLAARGDDVVIYASKTPDQRDAEHDGIRYRFIDHQADRNLTRVTRPFFRALPRNRPFFSSRAHPFVYWLRTARAIADDAIDVVHVSNYSQALPFIRRARPSAVLALHMQCEWLTQLARGAIRPRLAHADLILGASAYITRRIEDRYPEYRGRFDTLYNGVDTSFEPKERYDAQGGVRLLHVGRISPEKGLHVLVEAFNELVERHPELSLTFVGEESPIPLQMAVDLFADPEVRALRRYYEGSYLAYLQDRLSDRAKERVHFAGRVSHEATRSHYKDADVFVFPSIFEAFPIPPIEAMAAGVPVVATTVGGTVESVQDGETGFLVQRGDKDALVRALESLIDDEALRASFGRAGRQRATDLFAWDRVCDAFEHQVRQAQARRRRRAAA
jgi:glycosyltransferase involved in cell wall biosynthesis